VIVKVAPNRRDRRSSFETLGQYITEGIWQSGDRPDRTSWDDLTQYITQQSVLDALGDEVEKTIAVEAGNVLSLQTAAAEMRATAEQSLRATNPVLHLILSWPEAERPDAQAIFSAGRHMLGALGLRDHQYLIAIHDNTENRHAHIEVNRVHPTTYRPARLAWLHKELHKAAREVEITHGWSHDNGLYEIVEANGAKHVVPANERLEIERRAGSHGADRFETWSGEASLETWCRGRPADALRSALADRRTASWQDVHATLSRFGLELRDSGGRGMRVHDVGQDATEGHPRNVAVSASKAFRFMKRQDLEQRFGPFEPIDHSRVTPAPEQTYKRDPAKRLERRLERKALRDALHERFKAEQKDARELRALALAALKAEFAADDRARIETLKSSYHEMRARIGADRSLTPLQKQQAYMLAKLTHTQRRDQQREQMRQERAVRRELLPALPAWRAWVEAQALLGDEAAISALRGMVYQDKRDGKVVDASESDQPIGTLAPATPQSTDPNVRALKRLSWQVSTHGTVTYTFDTGGVAFIDAGPKLRFAGAVVSEDALRAALQYAADKWDGDLLLDGGDQVFRERVARMATEMHIELRNPDLRALQRQERLARPTAPEVSATSAAHALDPSAQVLPAEGHRRYVGRVVSEDQQSVVQHLGRHSYVLHAKASFDCAVPAVGAHVSIRYAAGKATAHSRLQHGR